MCLAIPGKVEEIFEQNGLKMAKVNFNGVRKAICLQYTPQATCQDYVLVHVGFAISIIDEDEAHRTFELLQMTDEYKDLDESEAGQ